MTIAVTNTKGFSGKTFVATELLATWFVRHNKPVTIYSIMPLDHEGLNDKYKESRIKFERISDSTFFDDNGYFLKNENFIELMFHIKSLEKKQGNIIIDVFDWFNSSFHSHLETTRSHTVIDCFVTPIMDFSCEKTNNTLKSIEAYKKPSIFVYLKPPDYAKYVKTSFRDSHYHKYENDKSVFFEVDTNFNPFKIFNSIGNKLLKSTTFYETSLENLLTDFQIKSLFDEPKTSKQIALIDFVIKNVPFSKKFRGELLDPLHILLDAIFLNSILTEEDFNLNKKSLQNFAWKPPRIDQYKFKTRDLRNVYLGVFNLLHNSCNIGIMLSDVVDILVSTTKLNNGIVKKCLDILVNENILISEYRRVESDNEPYTKSIKCINFSANVLDIKEKWY